MIAKLLSRPCAISRVRRHLRRSELIGLMTIHAALCSRAVPDESRVNSANADKLEICYYSHFSDSTPCLLPLAFIIENSKYL